MREGVSKDVGSIPEDNTYIELSSGLLMHVHTQIFIYKTALTLIRLFSAL